MTRATLDRVTLADSDSTEVVEGNHYFRSDSIDRDASRESDTTTRCLWKESAGYLGVEVDGAVIEDAAWYYPEPMNVAKNITDHAAFYGGKAEVAG